MTLFATFGGFATLIFASFAGSRWQKLSAHIALGVVGSMLIPLATVASGSDRARYELFQESVQLAGQCDDLAARLGRVDETVVRELAGLVPLFGQSETARAPCLLWVSEHLELAQAAVLSMLEPAQAVAQVRRTPWWKGSRQV